MSTKPISHLSTDQDPMIKSDHSDNYYTSKNSAMSSSAASRPPAKHFPFWWVVGTAIVGFVAGKFLVLGHSEGHGEKIGFQADAGLRIPEGGIAVTAENSELRPVARKVQAVGTLHGYEEVVLSSKADGRVARIFHDLSAKVQPGEVLLELDPIDAKLAVLQSEKMLETELSKWGFKGVPEQNADVNNLPSVVSAQLRFEHAASRLKRMLPLQASNAISADDLEQIQSEAKVMESEWRNQLLLANAAVATARLRAADLEIARQRLADCEIRVPVPTLSERTGEDYYIVTERLVSEGTLLRPGTEVFRLVLGRSLKLRLAVPEVNAGQIAIGQHVDIHVASTTEPQKGTVTTISPAIDRTSRTFLVEVVVPNENGVCRPGGFAKADILVDANSNAIMVPMAGVYSLSGNHKVFLIEDGKAKEFLVTLGIQSGNWIEITSPAIPAGARVVTSGQRLLSEGLPIIERAATDATNDSATSASTDTEKNSEVAK